MQLKNLIMSANTLKPFIKWVGGKTQLLDKIVPMIPEDTDVYIELFLGGGALLLNQLEHNDNIKTFVANDLNVNLIDTYECIKYSHSFILLKDTLTKLSEQFNSTDKKKEYYYDRRKEYNYLVSHPEYPRKMDANPGYVTTNYLVRKSALFIFLNKTGFNGLYRVNKRGEFNVPFNNAKHFYPDFTNLENLHKIFLDKQVKFLKDSYENTLDYIDYLLKTKEGEKPLNIFVYIDPPYKPVTQDGNEVSYTSVGFGDNEQEKLKDFCDKLTERGVKFLQSNSDPVDCKFFDNLYCKYKIKRVHARRSINSDGKKRGPITEILIKNY